MGKKEFIINTLSKEATQLLRKQIKNKQKTFTVMPEIYDIYKELEISGYAAPYEEIYNKISYSTSYFGGSSFKAKLTGNGERYFLNRRKNILKEIVIFISEIAAIFLASYIS